MKRHTFLLIATIIAFIADLTAIIAFMAEHSDILIFSGAGIAIALGIFLIIQEWGKKVGALILIAFLCVLLGLVIILLFIFKPPTNESEIMTSAREIRLELGTGIDLETDQTEGIETDGPNGSVDLYYYADEHQVYNGYLRANGGSIYHTDRGKDAEQDCKKLITSQGKAQTSVPLSESYSIGNEYCFRTSDGNIAWMRINDILPSELVLNVKVWRN